MSAAAAPCGLPYIAFLPIPIRRLADVALEYPGATSDHLLVLADYLDRIAVAYDADAAGAVAPPGAPITTEQLRTLAGLSAVAVRTCMRLLRDAAPSFAGPVPCPALHP